MKVKRDIHLLLLLICYTVVLSGFTSNRNDVFNIHTNNSFGRGERLEFRAHLGFINAAEAVMEIDENLHTVSGRPCYKVDIRAKTNSFFDLVMRVRDNWGSYIDTTAIIPMQAYRYIEEGKYRKYETIDFNHSKQSAIVNDFDKKTKELTTKTPFNLPPEIQDMVSGYYYFRTINFDTLNYNDTIIVNTFFDKEVYNFRVKYLGRERLKTKFGKIQSIVLSPIMHKNKIFDGENSVKIWLSADDNKIPLKCKASMFVGALELDLKKYASLKYPLNFEK